MSDHVAIVGATGALGFGLALRFAQAAVTVHMGSRSAERAEEAAAKARRRVPEGVFDAGLNEAACALSEIVILAVPFRNHSENLKNLQGTLREGQILVDATVPLAAAVGGRATRILGVPQGSAAQQAAEMAPDGVRVVSALHTIGAPKLNDLELELDEDVLVCGDKRADKRQVAQLIARIPGLRPVDAGRLEMSGIVESLTPLLISINARYKTHAGIKLTDLPEELWPDPSSS